jgi:hypothetical protein
MLDLHLADCLPKGNADEVEVVVPLVLDVGGGELGGAQRLLRLVQQPPPGDRQDERGLRVSSEEMKEGSGRLGARVD